MTANIRNRALLLVLAIAAASVAVTLLLVWSTGKEPAVLKTAPATTTQQGPAVPEPARVVRNGGLPNVLLVVFDTTRAQQMGAWGYPLDTTPNLDRLAAAGVRFDNFYSNSSWTRPGFASIFSGRYARSVGIYEERFDRLPDDVLILPEYLKERGYRTLGVTSNPNTNALFGFAQGYDAYQDSLANWRWMKKGKKSKTEGHAVGDGKTPHETATSVNERVLGLLDEQVVHLSKQPFFMHLVYMEPHTPRYPPQRHLTALKAQAAAMQPPLQRSQDVIEYDAELRFADEAFGELLDNLTKRGLMDNTLLVVVSDHGEGLDANPEYPGSALHGHYLTESLTRVPLILKHSDLPSGHVVGSMASTIDLFPTLADYLGAPLEPDAVDGRSLISEIRQASGEGGTAPPVFSETEMGPFNKVSLRTGTHTLFVNTDAQLFQETGAHENRKIKRKIKAKLRAVPPEELYRRADIEGPSRNRLEQEPGQASALRKQLAALEKAHPRRAPMNRSKKDVMVLGDGTIVPAVDAGVDMELSDDMEAQLRALGYLGD